MSESIETRLARLPVARDKPWLGYGAAVLIILLAWLARSALEVHLPPGFPYVTFFPAIVIVAVVFGTGPGIVAGLLGLLLSWYFFIPPAGFALSPGTLLALALYIFVVTVDVTLIHWMQRANALLRQQRELSRHLAESREILFRELQHRVGNNLQMVGSMLSLQKRKLQEPGAIAAVDEAAKRVALIGSIQRQLYDPDGRPVGLAALLQQVVDDCIATTGREDIAATLSLPETLRLAPEMAIPTSLIVAEAVNNAIEHGFAGQAGHITLTVWQENGLLTIAVDDDGAGLPAGFAPHHAQSLGLKLAMAMARQHGGTFELQTHAAITRAALTLPFKDR